MVKLLKDMISHCHLKKFNNLLYFYTEDVKDCDNLVDMLGDRDPLGYGDPMMYTYKFKKFLCSCALGMKPAKPWDG